MNKFVKISLIVAGVFAAVGLAFFASGAIIAGGLKELANQAASGALNHSNWHFEDGIYWTSNDEEIDIDIVDIIEKDVVSLAMEEKRYTYGSEIKNIVISSELGNVEIETSDDVTEIVVEIKDARITYFSEKVEGDTLYLTYSEVGVSLGSLDAPEISIEIPDAWEMENITVTTKLGNVEVCGFENGCGKLDLHSELGNIEVEEMHCKGATLATDLGNVKFCGKTEGDLNLCTSMGNVEAELEGNENDYNVEMETDMGNATYQYGHQSNDSGHHSSDSGHHSESHNSTGGHYSHHYEGAKANICIESSMGDVELCFTN